MSRVLRVGAGTVIVVLLIVGPVVFGLHQHAQMRNFHVVREGVLYRSGQMTPAGLKRAFHDYGIKTVISLRDGTTASDQEEEAFCGSEEVNFVRIRPSSWGDLGGSVPAEAGVKQFKEILADPRNYPVLIHCFAGIHRTGVFTAIYRMEKEYWSNDKAIRELRAAGYTTLDEELDILGFLEQYRPDWKPPEHAAPAKAPASASGQHTRRRGTPAATLVTARYGSVRPTAFKKRPAHARPAGPRRGHKTQSRPGRRGAITPGGAAAWPRPAGA